MKKIGKLVKKMLGNLGCLIGLHDYLVVSCRGNPFASETEVKHWLSNDYFNWRCVRCGKVRGRNVRQYNNIVMGDMAGGDIVKTVKQDK
jgi:hypothetical protein